MTAALQQSCPALLAIMPSATWAQHCKLRRESDPDMPVGKRWMGRCPGCGHVTPAQPVLEHLL